MFSARFGLEVFITRHARQRMAQRSIDEALLLDLVETGTARYKDNSHLWLYKRYNERNDNLLCVAAAVDGVLTIKTVMHFWQPEQPP